MTVSQSGATGCGTAGLKGMMIVNAKSMLLQGTYVAALVTASALLTTPLTVEAQAGRVQTDGTAPAMAAVQTNPDAATSTAEEVTGSDIIVTGSARRTVRSDRRAA